MYGTRDACDLHWENVESEIFCNGARERWSRPRSDPCTEAWKARLRVRCVDLTKLNTEEARSQGKSVRTLRSCAACVVQDILQCSFEGNGRVPRVRDAGPRTGRSLVAPRSVFGTCARRSVKLIVHPLRACLRPFFSSTLGDCRVSCV